MDRCFPIKLSTVLATRRVGHKQEVSRFFPKEGQGKWWTNVFPEESFHTKNLIMSAGEAEARDLGTGIEDRKFVSWLCSNDTSGKNYNQRR